MSSAVMAVTATGTSCKDSERFVAVTTTSSSRIGPALSSVLSCASAAGIEMIAAVHSETRPAQRRVVLVMMSSPPASVVYSPVRVDGRGGHRGEKRIALIPYPTLFLSYMGECSPD